MSTLSDRDEAGVIPVQHLLLIGMTKAGKSHYVADAAKAGFTILYLDKDNGEATLKNQLRNHPDAMNRVHYFAPAHLPGFLQDFLVQPIVRYSETTRETFISKVVADDERIVQLIPSRIPRNVILSIDSLTSLAFDAIKHKAEKLDIDLEDVDKFSREMYGSTGFVMTNIMSDLQHVPFHVIMQSHGQSYERKEKPKGATGVVLEKDMIVKETIMVPTSTSGPHGFSHIGKFFNQIGWLTVDRLGNRSLDFTVRDDRVGGGTPNGKGDPSKEYSFAKLFGDGRIEAPWNPEKPWIETMTGAEFNVRQAAKQAARPKLTIPAKKA